MNAMIRFRVTVPNAESPLYVIEVALTGIFDIEGDVPKEFTDEFVRTTVFPLVWPYAREVIESLSIRMRVPAIILPTLDLRTNAGSAAHAGEQASSEPRTTTE
jgi:preprotein translocase subunit SecB